jgi:hypothetical protein
VIGERQAWTLLGISPTQDRRAIKRAYAAKLKAIDPDVDVAAFLQLREALGLAQYLAEYGNGDEDEPLFAAAQDGGPDDGDTEEANEGLHVFPLHAPQLEIEDDARPFTLTVSPSPPVDPSQLLRQRLISQLNGAADPAALEETFKELRADPRCEAVDFADDLENWLAQVLLNFVPHSDPLVPIAVAQFGWADELQAVRPRWAQRAVALRKLDLECVAALEQPGHQWHRAYTLLREPGLEPVSWAKDRKLVPEVRGLLDSLRWHNPQVENMLNPDRVQAWEDLLNRSNANTDVLFKASGVSWYTWMLLAWFVIAILRVGFPLSASDPVSPVEEPSSQQEAYPQTIAPPMVVPPQAQTQQPDVDCVVRKLSDYKKEHGRWPSGTEQIDLSSCPNSPVR